MGIKFDQSPEMVIIDNRMTKLDKELDRLRTMRIDMCNKAVFKPWQSHVRLLRKILGKLDKKYWDLSMIVNPLYHSQEPLWKKQFS